MTDTSGPPVRPVVLTAPAKLTLDLRVTGVRADGYHLIDAEMVSLDLADEVTFADGDGLTLDGPEAVGLSVGAPLGREEGCSLGSMVGGGE